MAKKRKKQKGKRRWKWLVLIFIALLAFIYGYGYVNAHIVRVEYADVYVDGLKPGQDGLTILFVSDFKIKSVGGAKDAAALMKRLYELSPDIVILGGDYTSYSLGDRMTSDAGDNRAKIHARLRSARQAFFEALKPYNTTGRMFVIEGDEDTNVPGLGEDCARCNAILLRDGLGYVSLGGEAVTIYGAREYGGVGASRLSGATRAETVIAVTHNPDAYATLATVTDAGGRAVADLILAGHSMGGQVRVFGYGLMAGLGGYEGEFVKGHYKNIGVSMLVSSGIGTEFVPLRIGANASALFITLRAG